MSFFFSLLLKSLNLHFYKSFSLNESFSTLPENLRIFSLHFKSLKILKKMKKFRSATALRVKTFFDRRVRENYKISLLSSPQRIENMEEKKVNKTEHIFLVIMPKSTKLNVAFLWSVKSFSFSLFVRSFRKKFLG